MGYLMPMVSEPVPSLACPLWQRTVVWRQTFRFMRCVITMDNVMQFHGGLPP
jgi:hypothetical protein